MDLDCRSVNVEATLQGAGVSVELIDYRWNGVTDSSNLHSDHTISRRIAPENLVSHMRVGQYAFVRDSKTAFVPAGMPISTRTAGSHARMGVCHFSRERFDPLLGSDRAWDARDLGVCGDLRSPQLDKAIERLLAEAAAPGFASDILVDSLGVVAMVELARYLDHAKQRSERRLGGLAPWQMRRLTDYVESRLGGAVLIADLAQLCGVSGGHLQRAFRQSTGRTLHSYVEEVRLSHARSLLTTSDLAIKQVAARLGFNNASGFTIAFQRASGETPSAYRRRTANLR